MISDLKPYFVLVFVRIYFIFRCELVPVKVETSELLTRSLVASLQVAALAPSDVNMVHCCIFTSGGAWLHLLDPSDVNTVTCCIRTSLKAWLHLLPLMSTRFLVASLHQERHKAALVPSDVNTVLCCILISGEAWLHLLPLMSTRFLVASLHQERHGCTCYL